MHGQAGAGCSVEADEPRTAASSASSVSSCPPHEGSADGMAKTLCRANSSLLSSTSFLLACAAFLVLGAAWAQDFPGSMFSFLADRFGPDRFTETENQLLYSVYSWPNVVLVALAGFAMDGALGVRRGTVLFAGFACVGQLLFSAAVQWRLYPLAVAGRFVFGIGGEAIKVAQNTWIVRLSPSPNMAFRFGVVLSVARLAAASNFALTPTIADASPEAAIWLGTVTNAVSFGASLLLVLGHLRAARPSPSSCPQCDGAASIEDESPDKRMVSSNAITSPADSAAQPNDFAIRRAVISMYRTLRSFPQQVWLQLALCMFYHVGVLLLLQVGARYLQAAPALEGDARVASLLVSIPVFIGVLGIPLFGRMIDQFGHALASICGASLLLVLAHILLLAYLLQWVETSSAAGWTVCVLAWVLVGLSYAAATASIWPLVPFLLPPEQIATCYGTMTSIENLGLAVVSLLLPYLERAPQVQGTDWQYALPLLLLMLCALVAAGIAAVQLRLDRAQGGRLSKAARYRGTLASSPSGPEQAVLLD